MVYFSRGNQVGVVGLVGLVHYRGRLNGCANGIHCGVDYGCDKGVDQMNQWSFPLSWAIRHHGDSGHVAHKTNVWKEAL